MNHLPAFEDQLGDWLEDGPVDASDRLVDSVLAAFPSIPQRRRAVRVPWRRSPMNGYARVLIVIVAVAVIAVGGLLVLRPGATVGGPNPPPTSSATASAPGTASRSAVPSASAGASPSSSPAPSPVDTSLWKAFTSKRHGFSMRYPGDWILGPATAPWPAGTPEAGPPDPMLDWFSPNPVADPTTWFWVTSQPVPASTTSLKWLTDDESLGPRTPYCFPAPADMEQTTIGGQKAWIRGGVPGCGFTDAIVFAGGRVYILTGYKGSFFDRTLFQAFVSTVTFNPSKADDTPLF
jgi:hypothetical protein